ncbi:MAG: hypothetical protein IJ246_00410 [Clostridia bacterium]|nr:hypothetical protein [Clostridia bacterium]
MVHSEVSRWTTGSVRYCAGHQLPVDFVSSHPYPTDFAVDASGHMTGRSRAVEATCQDMQWLRTVIAQSAYPDAELHLTEWSSSPSSWDCTHDYLQEAAYIVKCNLDGIGLADSLSYWALSDVFEENGAGDSVFHGGFGLIHFQGIVKPSFHTYRMLSQMGDTWLYRDGHSFFTRRADGRLAGILYHYPLTDTVGMSVYPDRRKAQEELEKGEPVTLSYTIMGLTPQATVRIETLDRTHGWALPLWQQMHYPSSPTREETALLQAPSQNTGNHWQTVDAQGVLHLKLALTPWSVVCVTQEG